MGINEAKTSRENASIGILLVYIIRCQPLQSWQGEIKHFFAALCALRDSPEEDEK